MTENNIMFSDRISQKAFTIGEYRHEYSHVISLLHKQSIVNGFLSKTSLKFLNRLYRSIGCNKWSTIFIAEDSEDRINGFIAGAIDTKKMYRSIIGWQGFALFFYLLPQISNKRFLKKSAETFFYPIRDTFRLSSLNDAFGKKNKIPLRNQEVSAELLSIAVGKDFRSKGIGRELVKEFEQYLKKKKISIYKVVTDSKDTKTNHFYCSCGFQLHRQFNHHSNEMNEYVKML